MAPHKAMAIAAVLASAAAFAVSRDDYPDADCVTLNDETRIEYRPDGTFISENDERIMALTEKGRRALRTVSVEVSRRYGEAEIVKVEIIGADGKVREADFRSTLKEATDNSSVADNIYDPLDRRISCSVPGIEIGETRRVVVRRRTAKPRMRDTFAAGAVFESVYPVIRASFEVTAPAELPLAAVKLRCPAGDTVRRLDDRRLPDGRVVHTWVAQDVPQAFPEPDMPPFSSVAQTVLVSTCASWEEVSRWYWKLCRPRLEASNAAMTNKVQELIRGLDGRHAKIRALFRFVSQEIRYMGLTLEDEAPGYAPHDVSTTFDNRYGVCRDKAALLVQMLRIAGLEAYPALIRVGAKMDEDVPLPFFNHAVVWCGELMDPTNEGTRDLLPAYLDNCSYLVAHPEGRPLQTTPVKPASANAFTAETDGSLLPDGSAIIRTKASFNGANDLFRNLFMKMSPDNRRRSFENMLSLSFPGAELLGFEMFPKDLQDTGTGLRVELSARLPDIVIRGKSRDELKPPFVFEGFAIADRLLTGCTALDERRYPLTFFSTAATEEKLTLNLPPEAIGEVLKTAPEISVDRAGCGYLRKISVTDGILKAVRKREISTVEIAPENYGDLKYSLQEIERGSRTMTSFAVREKTGEAHVRTLTDRCHIALSTPFSWTMTNVWEKEILTYAGKKRESELSFRYNPCVGTYEIVSATVSNRNGRVYRLSPSEMNVLDAQWATSAPRYPAHKTLVANLPGVETGSVIRVVSVKTVTNSPVAFCGLFAFDSTDPLEIREVGISGYPLKIMRPRISGEPENAGSFFRAVTNPPCLKRERATPPTLLWRDCVLVSAADMDEFRESFFSALGKARKGGSEAAAAKAEELVAQGSTPEEKISAIRNWLYRNVRVAGPELFSLPFDRAFFTPDRSLRDSYASRADWMNLYLTMLKAAGFDAEFVLTDNDAGGYAAIREARLKVPQPDDFTGLFIRVRLREGAVLGIFGGKTRELILAYENEYTPLGVRDIDGRDGRTESFMSIDLNASGAARITVSNSTWGSAAGVLRKRYAEMLPEMRARRHAELTGAVAESAEAISALETDTEGYPFNLSFKVYAPGYAAVSGDSMTLEVPDIGGRFLPNGESPRRHPFGEDGRIRPAITIREVIFPEGFTETEHVTEPWEIVLPGESSPRCRLTTEKRIENGRLKIIFREELLPAEAAVFTPGWLELFRHWNRRTGSAATRTVSAAKASGRP